MAEEKKPKIDLKARLGKPGTAQQTPAPPPGGIPVPAPGPAAVSSANNVPQPAPSSSPSPKVPPPGVPVGPPPGFGGPAAPPLDPSNPLAAALGVAQQPAAPRPKPAPSAPPPPARIEVDEMAVQQARKSARKQGLMAGLVGAVVLGAIGYIAGGAAETSAARKRSVSDAKGIAKDVGAARDKLKKLSDVVEEGRKTLGANKFPDTLAKDLGGLNVDFDGGKLAGVRFSGYNQETVSLLFEFITSVEQINDRRVATANLLNRLEKPLKERFAAGGKSTINHVVLLGQRDPSSNAFAVLAPLTKAIEFTNPRQIAIPGDITATDPTRRANVTLPAYKSGAIDEKKGAAMYVLPKSVEAACPSETAGEVLQLGGQLSKFAVEIKGEEAPKGGDVITESKVGLLEKADRLMKNLEAVR